MYILCVFVWVRAPKNHFMSTFSFVAFLECSQKYWLDWFISTADALLVVTVLKGYHPLTQHFAQKPISPAISVLTFLNHYCFGCSWGFEDSHCKIEFNAFSASFIHSLIAKRSLKDILLDMYLKRGKQNTYFFCCNFFHKGWWAKLRSQVSY